MTLTSTLTWFSQALFHYSNTPPLHYSKCKNLCSDWSYGAPRANPWSPKNVPTYTPGRWSASVRKLRGSGGSSATLWNPPKHSTSIAAIVASRVTHSPTNKDMVSCVGGSKARNTTWLLRHMTKPERRVNSQLKSLDSRNEPLDSRDCPFGYGAKVHRTPCFTCNFFISQPSTMQTFLLSLLVL
jgi:hypothetical protein